MTISASPGQLVIEPDQSFILTNNGSEDRSFTYAHKTYIVRSGEHKVVPFDIIRLYFGDPRSVVGTEQRYEDPDGNPNARIAKRDKEVSRLAVFYGLYEGNEAKVPDHPHIKDMVVETLDRVEIFCPAVDPDGTISYAHREATDTVQDTATLIAQMQRRQDQQQALIEQLQGSQTQDPDDDVLVPDAPRFPE